MSLQRQKPPANRFLPLFDVGVWIWGLALSICRTKAWLALNMHVYVSGYLYQASQLAADMQGMHEHIWVCSIQ